MTILPQQLKTLHVLLNNSGLMEQKKNLIAGITGGRTESSKELTYPEAGALITYLKTQEEGHKMRRKIISLAHEMGWKLPGTNKIDIAHINDWCKKYGFGKKQLNEYTVAELPRLVTQFQNGPYKYYISNL